MKYIISCLVVIIVSFAIGALLTFAVNHLSKNGIKRSIKILLTVSSAFFLMLIAVIIFINDYNHARPEANKYLESSDKVTVTKTDFGYFFDGKGEDTAVIFYPGAKVEGIAYAELLYNIAESGVDTFLVEMPFRLAFFGVNNADYVLENYQYENYYMMGHSAGGVVASSYAAKHDGIKGLIFLASYPNAEIKDKKVLSIYGTLDGVLNKKEYDKSKAKFPVDYTEVVIDGGNHTQFGCYDLQDGDKVATVTYEKQQKMTIDSIINFLGI